MSLPGREPKTKDVWGAFSERTLPASTVFLADERVLRLHPAAAKRLSGAQLFSLRAGEPTKSLRQVERLAHATLQASRGSTVLALGGGTIGDLATVFAHLLKRGVTLIQVPTTLLAAVDSSVGGKGAVNVGAVKNALGVFHWAQEGWVCPEFFETLTEAQRREGRLEAWKKALVLDARVWERWCAQAPDDLTLVRTARALKTKLVARDPFEQHGLRQVLNFGHTFGHVIESVTRYRVRHGEAVGLGMLAALDVGVALRVTPPSVAAEVEAHLPNAPGAREKLQSILRGAGRDAVTQALRADKKGASASGVSMVLLERPGVWRSQVVTHATWARSLQPADSW
jgi:3-dehydroquinate synthase